MKRIFLTLTTFLITLVATAQMNISGPTNVIGGLEYDYTLSAPSAFPGAPWVATGGTIVETRNNLREATIIWNSDGFQQAKVEAGGMTFASLTVQISAPQSSWAFNNGKATLLHNSVGIGTSSPESKLHVEGNIRIPKTAKIILGNQSTGGYGEWIQNHNGNGISLFVNSTARLTVANGGRVGIGTTAPSSKLDIESKGNNAMLLRFSTERPWHFRQTNSGGLSNLVLRSEVDDKNFIIQSPTGTNNAIFGVDDTASGNLILLAPDGGRVGIGTSSPNSNYALSVNGAIRAKEIKVETGWADFVFEEDYELRDLEEVEEFIAENHHLPDIPSEAKVLEEGINLGEINSKLLQKIEELTLYMIDQNERSIEADQKIEVLLERINELENDK